MCLDFCSMKYMDGDYDKKTPAPAWKVFFLGSEGVLHPAFRNGKVPVGRWLSAVVQPTGFGQNMYRSGFHAFQSRKAAEMYRKFSMGRGIKPARKFPVLKVLLKGIHTYGTQFDLTTVVADQMRVLPGQIPPARPAKVKVVKQADRKAV